MKKKRNGFILLESLISLFISTMIIFTLTYCVNEQFKLLNQWEQRVTAHKIILLHLKSKDVPDKVIVKNKKYYFSEDNNKYRVTVNKDVYQIEL